MQNQVVICVGTAKAGTSWLYKCLEEHTNIIAAEGKETNYFLEQQNTCEGFFDYFQNAQEANIFFESSPKYFSNEKSLRKISACFPNVKIIVLLREPYARTLSHIGHMISIGRYDTDVSEKEIRDLSPEVFDQSRYEIYVPLIEQIFGTDSILVLDYDRIKTEPQRLLNEICDFIELPHFIPRFLSVKYNSAQARSHPQYMKIKSLYVKSRRYKIARYLTKFLRTIGFDSGVLEHVLARTNQTKTSYTPSSTFIQEELSESISYYNQKFKR